MPERFPRVMVMNNINQFITGTGVAPSGLTSGQVGAFIFDINSKKTKLGTGGTPSPTSVPYFKVYQNLGDPDFGKIRTHEIAVDKIVRWEGFKASSPAAQITYIGYDESDEEKDINALCGKELRIPLHIYEKRLARWYDPIGYNHTLVIDTGCCPDCGSPCTSADKLYIAQQIAGQINGTVLVRPGDIVPGFETKEYLTAEVVDNGESGDDLRVGVKITAVTINNDEQDVLLTGDPIRYEELLSCYFTVGSVYQGICEGTLLPVTTTQQANPGTGWASRVAAMEIESQGYDRVRDRVSAYPFNKANKFIVKAVAGTKYDCYILGWDWGHNGFNGAAPDKIVEPYELILFVPTTTGDPIEAWGNALTTGRHPAVNLN